MNNADFCPECGYWDLTVSEEWVMELQADSPFPPEPELRTELQCKECGWHSVPQKLTA